MEQSNAHRNASSLPGVGERQSEGEPVPASTTERARTLRRRLTDSERKLWPILRNRQFAHAKFKRQAPIGHYIVDFVSLAFRLVIELDGGQHNEDTRGYDNARTAWLESQGFRMLRFWNNEVSTNLDGVVQRISEELTGTSPSP